MVAMMLMMINFLKNIKVFAVLQLNCFCLIKVVLLLLVLKEGNYLNYLDLSLYLYFQ